MNRVFAFELTVFLLLEPARSVALLLGRRVISMLAFGAFQCDYFTHFRAPYSKIRSAASAAPRIFRRLFRSYFRISVTRPEATVRPPSRIAKRWVFSIAIGAMSSTSIETLSPGITISTPSGSLITPVTSVVLK